MEHPWKYWLHCEVLPQWARSLLTSQPSFLVTKVFHYFWCPRTAVNERGLGIFSALSSVLSFSVCVLGWSKDLCSWNLLQVVYWMFHSDVAYLEAASISKLRLNDLLVHDSYMKCWAKSRFFLKYTWLLVLSAQRWRLAVIPVGCVFLTWVRLGGTSM